MSSYAARNYSSESQQIGSRISTHQINVWDGASSGPCAEPVLVWSACAWASEPAVEPDLSVELGAAPDRAVDQAQSVDQAPLVDRVQSVDQVPSAGRDLSEGQARMEVS